MKKFKIALCQIKPLRDKAKSVAHAVEMIEKAAGNGAKLVMLPEIFYHPYELKSISSLADDGKSTLDPLRESAIRNHIHICTGSIALRENGKSFNRAYLVGPDGDILLEHSKCHLFDVDFKELRTRESKVFSPGSSLKVADTTLGKIGMLICYDIRFPEAARKLALQGAEIILVPAAFNDITGPAHWHITFRTRAVENQLYIAAASPARDSEAVYRAYGHSMTVNPWGEILCEAGEDEEIVYGDFDPEFLENVRGRLPLLKHRREDIY